MVRWLQLLFYRRLSIGGKKTILHLALNINLGDPYAIQSLALIPELYSPRCQPLFISAAAFIRHFLSPPAFSSTHSSPVLSPIDQLPLQSSSSPAFPLSRPGVISEMLGILILPSLGLQLSPRR